jgi:LytS/YehU family sensor histidine kinase
MYRYMLRCEEEALVSLREEIEFIREYISLLKVRFAEGFEIKFNIHDEAMQRMVIPCTVQLLVENAFKHNIVSTSNPLRISISADMERLTIENNIQPKFTQTTSTKLGQKYIREHYNSLSKQQIVIDNSENLYRVTIPLL